MPGQLVVPKLSTKQTVVAAAPRRIFANAHACNFFHLFFFFCFRFVSQKIIVFSPIITDHINSIALNSDGETFISSDDLRINLWNLGRFNFFFLLKLILKFINHYYCIEKIIITIIGISDQSFNIVDIKPDNMEVCFN